MKGEHDANARDRGKGQKERRARATQTAFWPHQTGWSHRENGLPDVAILTGFLARHSKHNLVAMEPKEIIMLKTQVNGIGIVLALVIAGATAAIAPSPAVAQSEPSVTDPEQGNVTERAVPGLAIPRQGTGLLTTPSPTPGKQAAPPLAAPQALPFKGQTPSCPPPAVTGLGLGIDAANELMACPWVGLSKQRVQDSERNIRESLEGKRLAHGGGKLSVKGNSLAEWGVSLKMTNVGANLDFAAPPGFRSASLNGFTLEAPLGRSWNIALRGQIEGRANVEVGNNNVLKWSPSLFPFGIRISNLQTRADVRLDPRDPQHPKFISATINPSFSVGGEGFIPVSIPVSIQTQVSGGKLHMVGHFTNLPVSLAPLDARLTGDLIMTFEPVRVDVGAHLSLYPTFLGVPQGVEGSVSTPNQQSGAQVDLSDNLADLPLGNVIFASTAFHAAFQLVTVTVRGELSIGLGFSYLGTKYDKRVGVPFGLSLPFVVPTTDELNQLILGLLPGMPRTLGDNQPGGVTPPLQTPVDFATPANEIETGILRHLPSGTVLSLDYPWLQLDPPVGRPLLLSGKGLIPPPTYGQQADSALWTGHYLAAESFRYAAMPSPAALERVKFVLGGIKRLFDVTGDVVGPPVRHGGPGELGFGGAAFIPVTAGPGILSRTLHRSDDPSDYTTGPLTTQPCYYMHPEGGWQIQGNPTIFPTYGTVPEATRMGLPQLIQPVGPIWYGWGCGTNHPVSRDQQVGVFMGLAMAYQNVNDPEVQATAKKLIEDALDNLLRNNWNVVLPPDNRIAPTSSYLGDFAKQLAYLRIGKTVNPAKYGPLYDKYAPAAELTWIPTWFSSIDPPEEYYKFNLSHAAFSSLLFLETDPSIRAKAMVGYNMLWGAIHHHKNAYFDLLHILVQIPADRAAVAASLSSPNSRINLTAEIQSLLNEWLIRRSLVMGPNGLPRNDVARWDYQSQLWPRDVSLYASLGGNPKWISNFALPLWGRVGQGMDFMWQRHPFQVGMDEKIRRPGAPAPDQMEVLQNGAPGNHRLREGAAVDYLLAYYMAVYLGLLPSP